MGLGARNLGFWDPLANFEVEGPEIFGTGMCDSGAVSVCGECHGVSNDVSNEVFFRYVFERYDAVCHVCATRRKRLWRPRKPFDCGPKHCRFSRTSHGCLPIL